MSKRPKLMNRTAQHRPALRVRRNRHDGYTALDLFSGFGGLSWGIREAGFDLILAANHNEYKVRVHEANHPEAEHWVADLVDQEAGDYHDVRELPPADVVCAGVSCVNHTQANSEKAYLEQATLWGADDPDYEARVTRSERDRATANCVLHYAQKHHPLMILVECTTEFTSWGVAVEGKPKLGDGSTFRWWMKQFEHLGYKSRQLYLNSRFFGVDQSRDRWYCVFWDAKLPTPDLDHKPLTTCWSCQDVVEAQWTWKTGIPPSGSVRYGKQYVYRCPRCRNEIVPPSGYALRSLDLTDLGTKIGEKPMRQHKVNGRDFKVWSPLAPATMARAERCRQKFPDFPAVTMPITRRGSESHPWQPLPTQTAQQERAVVSTGAIMKAAGNVYERPGSTCRTRGLDETLWSQTGTAETALLTPPYAMAIDNYQGSPRGVDDALPTQAGSETMGILSAAVFANRENATPRALDDPMQTVVGAAGSGGIGVLSSGVIPYRQNTVPTTHAEAMPTFTSEQVPGLLTAAGLIKNNGSIDEAKYRAHPVSNPIGAVTSEPQQALLFSGWTKVNGSSGNETAAHPVTDPLGTLTARDTTALLHAEWRDALADLPLEECFFRMMKEHEIGRGCGFDVDFGDYQGTFEVWGSASDQVDGFGNAVSPPVGLWFGIRMRAVLHSEVAA